MIVVKVELWPRGYRDSARSLGELHIWNDGTGTEKRGNYKAQLYGKKLKKMGKNVELKDWPRKSKNVWDLVLEMLSRSRSDGKE